MMTGQDFAEAIAVGFAVWAVVHTLLTLWTLKTPRGR